MLGLRDLNRTLLARQHLLERRPGPALDMVEHLVGLQAQETLSPYLSLAARIEGFDPLELSAALETGEAARLLTMRTTIHLHHGADARRVRSWVQPALDQMSKGNQNSRPARQVPTEDLAAAARAVLADGPLPVKDLGERLAALIPDLPATALAHAARERVALVQLPPRGLWRRSGGVVYQLAENHLAGPAGQPDPREMVRRYLRAFGPATAADMTAWSRVTRLGPVFASMGDELEVVACHDGKRRYDVPGAPYVDGEAHAPVRLLGTYDNLWLSHADRSHVMDEEARRTWMGANGGVANTVFVDGFMAGLWWWRDDHVETDVLGRLTRAQRLELADEVDRITAMMRR